MDADVIALEGRAGSPVNETPKRERKKPAPLPELPSRNTLDGRLAALRRSTGS
jgi:hypothetical protein